MIEDLETSPLPERKIMQAILVPADGSSAEATSEPQAHCARCCCGGLVGLRSLILFCVAQSGMAAVMFALGIVGMETLCAAIYWPPMTLLGAWLLRQETNIAGQPTRPQA